MKKGYTYKQLGWIRGIPNQLGVYGLVLAGLLFSCPTISSGGLLMEALALPTAESDVWALAFTGAARYAGGWHALDEPIPAEVDRERQASPIPLRIAPPNLEMLAFSTPIWPVQVAGRLSVIEQLLMAWTLRVPEFPAAHIRLSITERMLLVPRQWRIALSPAADVADAD